jgi:hypothetical protein
MVDVKLNSKDKGNQGYESPKLAFIIYKSILEFSDPQILTQILLVIHGRKSENIYHMVFNM